MSDWSDGYVTDVDYTHGYYPDLQPRRVQLALLAARVQPPEITAACELGFGQGVTINIHAAAGAERWYGTDFNAAQTAHAQAMARASGAPLALRDDAFAQYSQRDDLPAFDFIALHGIWSWISDATRDSLIEFIDRRLKPGGVLFVSYNTLPGWSAFAAIRHLLMEHSLRMSAPGMSNVHRLEAALGFTDKLLAAKPMLTGGSQRIAQSLDTMRTRNRQYLAHEYLNRNWQPMYFSQVAEQLQAVKLSFVCSADLLNLTDPLNLTPEQSALLATIPDANYRETVRDMMVNQQFRRDYWVRGPRAISKLEQLEAFRAMRFVLAKAKERVTLAVKGLQGSAQLEEHVYRPLIDFLGDYEARTGQEIETFLTGRGMLAEDVMPSVFLLTGSGCLAPAGTAEDAARVQAACDGLNAFLHRRARHSVDTSFNASPVLGGGLQVDRFEQLFLLARSEGLATPAEWAAFTWRFLDAQKHSVLKDGKPLDGEEANLQELQRLAEKFAAEELPLLIKLGVATP